MKKEKIQALFCNLFLNKLFKNELIRETNT